MAWDTDSNGKHFHFELGGLVTTVKTTAVPIGGTTFQGHTSIGGGIDAAFNFELFKGFRVLANGMWGDGVGRYLIGLAPQTVVRPIATGPATFTIDNSLVHSGSALVGIEATVKKTQLGFYYGGMYAQRNAFHDVTNPANLAAPVACEPGDAVTLKPCAGFGGVNSPNSANRAIQEASFDWTQTFWRNPQYGAVFLVTQTSYLTRSPWVVFAGAPKNAHLVMNFVSLRYALP
jgi:hypothetical protein